MMLVWMAYATLTAAAFGAAAWLVDFALAGRLARRRVLWSIAFFASAIGPIVFSATRGASPATVAGKSVAPALAARWQESSIVSDRVVAAAWLTASVMLALWLVATQRRLRRRLAGYRPGTVAGEQVRLSSRFGPALVGVVRPQVVLPEWTLGMGEADRRLIVAHETEHRRARDPLLAAVALVVAVALPWNAALWWQLRRLRLAIEIDCDLRVVSIHGRDRHAYGMLLLATRERASRGTPVMALAMAAMRSGLGRRVEALVDGRRRSVIPRLGAVGLAVLIGAEIVSIPAPRLSLVRQDVIAPAPASPAGARTGLRLPQPPPGQALVVLRSSPTVRAKLVPAGDTLKHESR